MRLLPFVALLTACAGAPPEALVTPAEVRAPATPAAAPPKDSQRWLVLEQHAARAPSARYVALELADDPRTPPVVTELGESPTHPLPPYHNTPHHAVATQDGARWVQVVASERGGLRAVVRSLPASTVIASVELGDDHPAALHLVGDALWIGTLGKVLWADIAASSPSLRTLVDRAQKRNGKYYDLFTRAGDRLVAIDDVVRPLYADLFALDGRGAPAAHLADWTLPGLPNGKYTGAFLLRGRDDSATLFTTSTSSSGYTGPGQGMFRLPIVENALPDTGLGHSPDISEIDMTARRTPHAVLAGTAFTAWEGFTLSPDGTQVLIAAGERGLLLLPSALPAGTMTAEALDLGGRVRDITARGSRLFALVRTSAGTTELLHLSRAKASFEITARHALPGELDRFVD